MLWSPVLSGLSRDQAALTHHEVFRTVAALPVFIQADTADSVGFAKIVDPVIDRLNGRRFGVVIHGYLLSCD